MCRITPALGKGEESVGDDSCSVIVNVFYIREKLWAQLNVPSCFCPRWNTLHFKGALSLRVRWARKRIAEGLRRYPEANGEVPSRNLDSQPPALSYACKFSSETEGAFFSSFHRLCHSHNLLQVKAKDFPVLKTYFATVQLSEIYVEAVAKIFFDYPVTVTPWLRLRSPLFLLSAWNTVPQNMGQSDSCSWPSMSLEWGWECSDLGVVSEFSKGSPDNCSSFCLMLNLTCYFCVVITSLADYAEGCLWGNCWKSKRESLWLLGFRGSQAGPCRPGSSPSVKRVPASWGWYFWGDIMMPVLCIRMNWHEWAAADGVKSYCGVKGSGHRSRFLLPPALLSPSGGEQLTRECLLRLPAPAVYGWVGLGLWERLVETHKCTGPRLLTKGSLYTLGYVLNVK